MLTGVQYAAKPTHEQVGYFAEILGACRTAHNEALAERCRAKLSKEKIDYVEQRKSVIEDILIDHPSVPTDCLVMALKALDQLCEGNPDIHRVSNRTTRGRQAFHVPGGGHVVFDAAGARIWTDHLGWLSIDPSSMRSRAMDRPPAGAVISRVTVSFRKDQWFVSLAFKDGRRP